MADIKARISELERELAEAQGNPSGEDEVSTPDDEILSHGDDSGPIIGKSFVFFFFFQNIY